MELYVFVLTCVLMGFMLIMFVLDWYDNYKEHKTMFIKDREWLLMEDNTKDRYSKSFAHAKYIRPGSYIQDVSFYQPVYDESTGVFRIIDNFNAAGEPCSVSSPTLSENIKQNLREKKGE